MRTKLHQSNPIKYSNRSCLDNDLRILASACNHKVPPETVDLEEILASHQNKANMLKYTSGFENSGTGIGKLFFFTFYNTGVGREGERNNHH